MSPDPIDPSRWLDDFFASYFAHRPVSATFVGAHEHDDRLPDLSEEGLGDVLADGGGLLEGAHGLPADGGTPEAVDVRLACGYLETQLWELEADHGPWGNPSFATGEAVFGVMGLFLSDFAPLSERIDAAAHRMEAIPDFLDQARAGAREAPSAWTERAVRECDGAAAFLQEGVARLASTAVEAGQAGPRLTDALTRAAATAHTAFATHRAWLGTELLERSHDRHACGPEALDLHIRAAHFLHENPFFPGDADGIAAYAEAEMEEADAYLTEHAGDFGAATPAAALELLRDAHPGTEGYYTAYEEVWDDVRAIAEERSVLTWPDFPIRYVARPAWVRAAAPHLYFLFYRSPAAFGRPRVHDYLVAPLPDRAGSDEQPREEVEAFLRANNASVIKLNHVIHHGGLGHHVQNWHAFRAESRVGRMAAVDCASRIAMLCGGTMAEGWACYATDLASEIGALTPLEAYAETHSRVRMAARAIVDVRLHQGRMSFGEAVEFYRSRAGMSEGAARGEVVKNGMFPGGALMYLMGTDTIHALRRELERRRGASFDLCAFHDTFLSFGSIPVSLIAKEMMKDGFEMRRCDT